MNGNSVFILFFYLIVVVLITATIVMLLRAVTCPTPTNTTLNASYYMEPFWATDDDAVLSKMKQKMSEVQSVKEQLQASIDELGDVADETCDIMRNVEKGFVSNASALSEAELELSQQEQQQRLEQKTRRARLNFQQRKKTFAALKGLTAPVYECFFASPNDVAAVQDELMTEVDSLEKVLDSAEIVAANVKAEQVGSLLRFNFPYLTKGFGEIETFVDTTATPAQLLARADKALGKAYAFMKTISQLQADVSDQKNLQDALTNKGKNLLKGDISEADIRKSKEVTAGLV